MIRRPKTKNLRHFTIKNWLNFLAGFCCIRFEPCPTSDSWSLDTNGVIGTGKSNVDSSCTGDFIEIEGIYNSFIAYCFSSIHNESTVRDEIDMSLCSPKWGHIVPYIFTLHLTFRTYVYPFGKRFENENALSSCIVSRCGVEIKL